MNESGVGGVPSKIFRFNSRIDPDGPTRQGDETKMMLLQQLFQFAGGAEFRDHIRAQLNAWETERGDIGNRLPILAVPGDGGIAYMDLGRRRTDGCVEVR